MGKAVSKKFKKDIKNASIMMKCGLFFKMIQNDFLTKPKSPISYKILEKVAQKIMILSSMDQFL